MDGTSLTTIKFCDLPKPIFQLLVDSIDAKTRHRLRSACWDTLSLVDEFCSVSVCIRGRDVSSKRALAYGQLSGGISRLCIADCVKDGLFREAVCVQSAFSQLSHIVINYRLATTTRHLATAAGSHLHSITIVSGRRKGSRWNIKYCKTLGTLQSLKTLSHLHLTLHTTQHSAQQLGLLTQIQSLKLSLLGSSSSCGGGGGSGGWWDDQDSRRPELVFQPEFWDLGVAPLTGLTSLQMCVPLVVERDVGLPNIPPNLQSLFLQLLSVNNNSDPVSNSQVSGVAAAQQILHNLPDLVHLTRLVIHEDTQNDWINASEKQITAQGAENLGRLCQLRVLDLSVGHWKVNLEQLQPLSGLCNLTELVVPELVMGYGDEGIDDQLGSMLNKEEMAAVAAGMAAAAAAAGSSASRQWQQQANAQGHSIRVSRASSGSSRHHSYLAAAAAAAAAAPSSMCTPPTAADSSSSSSGRVIKINGSNVVVPLLPQLKVLRCSTLWWRLPLVVLAPALQDVKYKRLRNLGYGSFVLPDLTEWEEEQTLPAEFEQMLQQQGNAFNNILAPQGGFNLNNPAAAAAADQAAAAVAVEAAEEAVAAAAAAAEHGAQVGLVGPLEELVHELQDWQQHWQQQQQWQQWQQQVGQQQHQQQQEQPAIVVHNQVPQGEANVLVPEPAAAAAGAPAAAGAAEPAASAAGSAGGIFAAVAAAEAAVAAVEQAVMHVNHPQQQPPPPPPPPPPLLPQVLLPTAAPAPHIAINIGPAPPFLAHTSSSSSSSVTPQPLQIAPANKCYGDVLRGQLCLRSLDLCVTSLCKIMRMSSLALAGLERLQLHMLGEVMLAPGGLPTLAALTHLEFYLPDERNWDANYNDYEDIALWQHQHNVTNIVIKGTYHAGGFFAPGHWDIVRQCMPDLHTVTFVRCKDMHVAKLQMVVDSKAAKVVEFCDWRNVDIQDGEDQDAAAAAAASSSDSGSEAAGAAHAAAAADHDDASQQHFEPSSSDMLSNASSLSVPYWPDSSGSSSSSNADEGSADLQGPQGFGDGMAVNPQLQNLGQDIGPPPLPQQQQQQPPQFLVGLLQSVTEEAVAAGSSSGGSSGGLVDRVAVLQMAVAAADTGVEVRWVSQPPAWKALFD